MGSPNRPVLKQKRRYRYGNAFSFSYPAMFNLVLIYPTIIALSPCSFLTPAHFPSSLFCLAGLITDCHREAETAKAHRG